MPFVSRRSALVPAGLALVSTTALALVGCIKVPTQSASMQASPQLIVSMTQLQLRAFEMGRNLSTLIEQAADSILAVSSDPAIRQNALLWKISAVPLVQEAALRNDPFVAVVDLLAFAMQQLNYLTTGSGRASFGPEQPVAVDAAQQSEREALSLLVTAHKAGTPLTEDIAAVRTWAANHPMQGPTIRRASIFNSNWEALGLSTTSFAGTLGNVDQTLVNLTYRLSYLNETLAEQARWNAELAIDQMMQTPRVDSIFGTGIATLGSVGTLVDGFPTLLDRQRDSLLLGITRERIAMFGELDRQRALVFVELSAQREALLAGLTAERLAVMEQLGQERATAMLAADSIVLRAVDRSEAGLSRLVLRVVLGTLLVVLALLGSGLLLINRWRTASPRMQ